MKTRSRVLELLRSGQKTVDELARALGVTANAIRMHLDSLAREGAVRQAGVLRSGTAGKPAVLYEVTAGAEAASSKAYAPVLANLIGTLAGALPQPELERVLRASGRRLAAERSAREGPLFERAQNASALLNELGGVTQVEQNGVGVVVRASACPLAVAVGSHPLTCVAMEEFVGHVAGARARLHCAHHPRPACSFTLSDM